jgi:protease I
MSSDLTGRRIAFLVSNCGAEQAELTDPWEALARAGAISTLIAPEGGIVQTVNDDLNPGEIFHPDLDVEDADPDAFDALVLPGGVANPDRLRTVSGAVSFVERFAAAGKPIGSICHGPWMLVEADVIRGKSLTSWPSLRTDVENAGGDWHDDSVVVCDRGFPLITGRTPDDLPEFNKALIAVF